MKEIHISIREGVALQTDHTPYITGDGEYRVVFDLEKEWEAHPLRTARFLRVPRCRLRLFYAKNQGNPAAIGRVPAPPGGSRIFCEKPQQICIRLLIWLQGRCVTHPASAYRRTAYSFRSYFAEAPVSRLRQGR